MLEPTLYVFDLETGVEHAHSLAGHPAWDVDVCPDGAVLRGPAGICWRVTWSPHKLEKIDG
jgi:hypothetical protein